jgi:hypothetical protein
VVGDADDASFESNGSSANRSPSTTSFVLFERSRTLFETIASRRQLLQTMAATTASAYLVTSAALVDRMTISEEGLHLRVVVSTSLKVGDIIAVLLPSEGFGWEGRLAALPAAQITSTEVFEGNDFQFMRVLHVNQTGGLVASCVSVVPSDHIPMGPVTFLGMVQALVPHGWFLDHLEASGAIFRLKRAADEEAEGGPASRRAREDTAASAAGETSALSTLADARRGLASVLDLDGVAHDTHPSGTTVERVEALQFLLRMFDAPRYKAFVQAHLLRGDRLLENAYEAVGTGVDGGSSAPFPGLHGLQDLRALPILVGGADEGSRLHGLFHGKWKADDLGNGCYLDCVTAGAVLAADYLPKAESDEARAVSSTALRNFERLLCAVFGADFTHVLRPLREGLEKSEDWSRYDNVLIVRNIHVMLCRWISDVHTRTVSARFPSAVFKTPMGCAALLALYVGDLLTAAQERREADDWCAGGHVDFYRAGRGRYWFIVHPKIGGHLQKSAPKKNPNAPAPRQEGGAGGGRKGEDRDSTPPGTFLMRDGQRSVCSLHLCGALLHLKVKGAFCKCGVGKAKCKFWHPTQLTQLTRSQAMAALQARQVAGNEALASAAAAAANVSGLIWKAEPVKTEARDAAGPV